MSYDCLCWILWDIIVLLSTIHVWKVKGKRPNISVGGQNWCHWPLHRTKHGEYSFPNMFIYYSSLLSFAGSRPSTAFCTLSPAGVLELFMEDDDFQTRPGRRWLSSWMKCFFLEHHMSAEKTDGFHLMEQTPELENQWVTEQFTSWAWNQVIRWTLWRWAVNKQTFMNLLRLNVFVKHLRRRST